MKGLTIILFTLFCVFQSCSNYYNLDKSEFYVFNKNDTLIYRGVYSSDTFIIESKSIFMTRDLYDINAYYEREIIHITELTHNCKDSIYDYCSGMHIEKSSKPSAYVNFRNVSVNLQRNTYLGVDYKIDKKMTDNSYTIVFPLPDNPTDKDINTVYYCHKYGITAYKLAIGELFELVYQYSK